METLVYNCKNQLKLGLTESTDINWLNKTCEILRDLCNLVQQNPVYKNHSKNTIVIEKLFLYIKQIVCCIKCLEEVLNVECDNDLFLVSTREHFIDRILWCINELYNSMTIRSDSIDVQNNLVHCMDALLDTIGPLTLFNKNASVSEVNIVEIQYLVELLITHTINFQYLALVDDKKSLSEICQKVFLEWKLYEKKVQNDTETQQSLQLQASSFESALYQLDELINNCLLKLVLTVFVDLKEEPIDRLRNLFAENADQIEIDENIEKIDKLNDRLLQIGMFGIAFSSDYRIKCSINSSLASLEALDSFLIPSIQSSSDTNSKLLEKHWNDEVTSLYTLIQSIIDTNAFCSTVIELFQNNIVQLSTNYDTKIVTQLLAKCNILLSHFDINFMDLKLNIESMRKIYYDDIKIMVKECTAAIEQCSVIEWHRVVKRFKILLSSLKKFQTTINAVENDVCQFGNVTAARSGVEEKSEFVAKEISDSMKAFNSIFVDDNNSVTPIRNTILYESKRRQFSATNRSSGIQSMKFNMSPVKTVKKRSSLRVAMFKRAANIQLKQLNFSDNMENSLSLHITDILEDIKDLSCTLH